MKIFLTLLISLACVVCLTAQSKNAEKAFNKGLDYFQEQSYEEALTQFREAIWADPDHEAAHHFLAQIYTEQGKNSFAIKHYKRVLAINSNREESWVELSKAYAKNDQGEKARTTLEKAVKGYPDFLTAKIELDNLMNPPVEIETEAVVESVALETPDIIIQPPTEPQIVSLEEGPAILLEERPHANVSFHQPMLIPNFEMEDVVVNEPISKEELMAPAPAAIKAKKGKKDKFEEADPSGLEEMSTAVLDEILPALADEEEVEMPVAEKEAEVTEEILTKEENKLDVTEASIAEVVEVAEVAEVAEVEVIEKTNADEASEEEVVPAYSSTPRIPGIRMPSPVDHVVKVREEARRNKKRKN